MTQVLLFSGVTAFNSLSADLRSMLVPRSAGSEQSLAHLNMETGIQISKGFYCKVAMKLAFFSQREQQHSSLAG